MFHAVIFQFLLSKLIPLTGLIEDFHFYVSAPCRAHINKKAVQKSTAFFVLLTKEMRNYFVSPMRRFIQGTRKNITNAAARLVPNTARKISLNGNVSNIPPTRPPIKLPRAAPRNQIPIICPTIRAGASFVIALNPTGERHSSPIV